ncbi:MAG: hypothetical protein ACOCRN_03840 [Spirochaetia bacterium]
MRTTIDLPDDLFRKLKSEAAIRGKPLKELITEAVEHELGLSEHCDENYITFPLIRSDNPGSINPDPDAIANQMDSEDFHVSP